MMQEKTLLIHNKQISYSVSENTSNNHAVVFLHGFLETKQIWKNIIPKIEFSGTVVTLDLPGHGKSDLLSCPQTMEEAARALQAVLKHEKIKKAFIIGHSMGGYVGLEFIRLFPQNATGLILFFSTALSDSEEKKQNRLRAIEALRANRLNFILQSIPNLFAIENRLHYSDHINKLIKQAEHIPAKNIEACLLGMKDRRDSTDLLKQNDTTPVFYIIGRKDPVIDFNSYINQIKLPAVKGVRIIENCGHMGFIEAEDVCTDAINGFLRTVHEPVEC
jgi:pimeloyl-ACP methyl ester carboxylesterase